MNRGSDSINNRKILLRHKFSKGYTLLELIVYSALIGVLVILVFSSIVRLGTALTKAKSNRQLNSVGNLTLERIIREIRLANDISATTTSSVILDTIDNPNDENQIQAEIKLLNSAIMLQKPYPSGTVLKLTPDEVNITRLKFVQINAKASGSSTTTSKSLRIEIDANTGEGNKSASTTYHGYAILRESINY